ncbi:NAD-glutamate dehydrogenase [Hansschlegelia quercus]|uniref:NAD-glutamate dehydrogenase n=1 Tax=Hansschlegelia quercus TaxID=2528245 RepID=A0A4Q9GIG3_9HYPH|nr:NAD-glutamate dehydrogenase [Hansschlegelia quercus]TBN53818.1 NAD-glutamate dehydrogenase [Hansschlegelia quercus]
MADAAPRDALISEAAARAGVRADGPPRPFVEALFVRASREDLAPFSAAALADLAYGAWAHLQHRSPGEPDIRLADHDLADVGEITALEIANDDMPFLLDSVRGELTERGLEIRFVVHPIFALTRNADGKLTSFEGDADRAEFEHAPRESLIHIHLERIDDAAAREDLVAAIRTTLGEVRAATEDHDGMVAAAGEAAGALAASPLDWEATAEAAAFLAWLANGDFIFLGAREYRLVGEGDDERLEQISETGLGVLRDPATRVLRRGGEMVVLTPEIRAFLHEKRPLIVTKASVKSKVFRRLYMDYIGVKRFNSEGELTGELRIVGLFTASALMEPVRETPLVRAKAEAVKERAGFDPESHSGHALAGVLEAHPRDEMFQADEGALFDAAMEIIALYERPRVKALTRADRFGRFISVLVYVPRERYDSDVRAKIGAHLAERFGGRVSAYYPAFPEGPLARVHFIIGLDRDAKTVDARTLDLELADLVRNWGDHLRVSLARDVSGAAARTLGARYGAAFGPAYEARVQANDAVVDIAHIEGLTDAKPFAVDFYRPADEPETRLSLKVFSRRDPIELSSRVPILENMGFRVIAERSYRIEPTARSRVWLHDMVLERANGGAIQLTSELDERLEATLVATLSGQAESDGYNALALEGGLEWRDVALLRALSRFLRQTRAPYDQDYLWRTLVRHSAPAAKIVALFHARFHPAAEGDQGAREEAIAAEIDEALDAVDNLDEDRIVRRFMNLVRSGLRTNFYQREEGGSFRPTIAIKFDSRKLEDLPAPRPLFEIFVYSPRVEGVHLRFGKVARGGLRWSDRPQDFRTEVLGLVKAQQVKNAVIVPVGAKGGFVPKQLPAGPREAWFAEGTEAYKLFINALLDVTDDLDGDTVVPPKNVVRHDGDDPYLVVAADKGTATFSDTANGIAIERGFWLGDAFASGGSVGYDHKAMGITARGAWEAVKRHFREIDVDIQTTPFSVVGVGDMSGDVFGNGMLLSRKIRLIAAFDHRDIFIDPNPDAETAFEERSRLFGLARSSWADYDRGKISAGGSVFSRSLKSIQLSSEAQEALGLQKSAATPQEVMRAILAAPADLLWFGGIGTYVRASFETDDQVGDRANDAIRVTAQDLRAKVVGEGANLGLTQKGRIEATRRGLRLNTDAIDNAAGVNTSDVEVNIKIAFAGPLRDGSLLVEDRNATLASMTDEVGRLVLRSNYDQTLAVSLAARQAAEEAGFHSRLMQTLEARDLLDRTVETLPDDATLSERVRSGEGLSRPEISTLIAWAKIALFDDLLASTAPDDPYFRDNLTRYFPEPMRERFGEAIAGHRLKREIVATAIANAMVNRGGPAIAVRLADQTGAGAARVAAAFAVARDAFRMDEIHGEIDALDARIPGALQLELYAAMQELLLHRMVWLLRNVDLDTGLEQIVARFRDGVDAVSASLEEALGSDAAERRSARAAALVRSGLPEALAARFSAMLAIEGATDAVLIAEKTGRPVDQAATALFAIAERFRIGQIVRAAQGMTAADYYERLAIDRALDQIGVAARAMAIAALNASDAGGAEAVAAWTEGSLDVERVRRAASEIAGSGLTLARLSVASSLLGDLARETG